MEQHDNENKKPVQSSVELLTNWSKWLITINFSAATGCIVVLKVSNETAVLKSGLYLFAAVLCFALSVGFATRFVFLLAKQAENTQPHSTQKFLWLAKAQWILFLTGLFFLLIWVAILSKIV